MKFFKKIAGFLGFAKDESHSEEEVNDVNRVILDESQTQHLPRKGFSVPVQVAVERASPGPVFLPTNGRDGGVQGFKWYARRLRIDEEGDVADEFLDEVLPEVKTVSISDDKHKPLPRFVVKHNTLPAKVRNQALTPQGRLQHSVEHQGRLQWV